MESQSDLPNTRTGNWTGAPPEAVTHQSGEQRSESRGMEYTSSMIREERGTGMQRGGMGERRVAHGRGEQESEDRGMEYVSGMIREAHEEGDPEFQRREEDLHARQQDLGRRESSLREREGQLQSREQNLRERQKQVTGRGLGATDYTDDIHIQNRR
jgi:hypothetical protein